MSSGNLRNELIRIEREIKIYRKNDSEIIREINIDSIDFNIIIEIVPPPEDDPLLYEGHILNENQLIKFNHYLQEPINPNFDLYFYVLECTGIYK
ncbi:hypothetical protein ACDQ55_21510 [Chitinophaga sp. 30R24]|uniref:DUF7683 domain-containing protein n=1 Tax=Chitinophaga sp. 30R24 TaxID=3248838 RepID=UPI003B91058C